MFAGTTASRWDADDDEEEEEQADVKPVKSRWGDDDQVNSAALNEDDRPELGSQKTGAAREAAAGGEEGEKNQEADAPVADGQDTPAQAQESGSTRKSKRNMLFGCRSKEDFEHLRDIGQGTYGAVSKCGPASPCFLCSCQYAFVVDIGSALCVEKVSQTCTYHAVLFCEIDLQSPFQQTGWWVKLALQISGASSKHHCYILSSTERLWL